MGPIVIAVISVGVIAVIAVASSGKAKKMRAKWVASAAQLGLSFDEGPHSDRKIHARHYYPQMYGQHDGQDVYVGIRTYTTGSGKNRTTHYYTFVDVIFDTPLKRGLRVARADGVSRFFGSIFGQRDMQIGDPAFDKDFRIDGIDEQQIGPLLDGDGIKRALTREYPHRFKPSISDDRVRIEASGILIEVDKLAPQVQAAVDLHGRVLATWETLPPSAEERQITDGWQQLAELHELEFRPRGMVMWGAIDRVKVHVEVALDEIFSTELSATIDPPLGVGLTMKKQGALSGVAKLFGAQDVEVGDDRFDDRYVIKGKDVERIKEIFASDARDRLLRLDDATDEMFVSDELLSVTMERIVGDKSELEQLIAALVATVSAMVQYRRPTAHGPFR